MLQMTTCSPPPPDLIYRPEWFQQEIERMLLSKRNERIVREDHYHSQVVVRQSLP